MRICHTPLQLASREVPQRSRKRSGLIGLALLWTASMASGAAEPESSTERLVVEDCLVKFIEQALLASDRIGVIEKLDCREGDFLKAGARVVQLRDDVPRAHLATLVRQAESQEADVKVRNAERAWEFSRQRLQIALDAQAKNRDAVSRAELLEFRTAMDKAKLDVEEAALELEITKLKKNEAEAELKSYLITAPFGGFVSRVLKQRGESIQQGAAVAEMVNPRRLKIEGYVGLAASKRLKAGMAARAQTADANQQWQTTGVGRLVFVDVGAQPVNHKVRIWAEINNEELRIRAGEEARLEIDLSAPIEDEPAR